MRSNKKNRREMPIVSEVKLGLMIIGLTVSKNALSWVSGFLRVGGVMVEKINVYIIP